MTATASDPTTVARELVDAARSVVDAALRAGAEATDGGLTIDPERLLRSRTSPRRCSRPRN